MDAFHEPSISCDLAAEIDSCGARNWRVNVSERLGGHRSTSSHGTVGRWRRCIQSARPRETCLGGGEWRLERGTDSASLCSRLRIHSPTREQQPPWMHSDARRADPKLCAQTIFSGPVPPRSQSRTRGTPRSMSATLNDTYEGPKHAIRRPRLFDDFKGRFHESANSGDLAPGKRPRYFGDRPSEVA